LSSASCGADTSLGAVSCDASYQGASTDE